MKMDIVEDLIALHQNGVVEWEDVNGAIEAYFLALADRRTPIRRSLLGPFELQRFSDQDVVLQFRFSREHLTLLQQCLEIPNEVYLPERRCRVPGKTALCILLRRLAYPNRLCDLEPLFRMSTSALSSTFHFMVTHIMTSKGHLLMNLDSHSWLDPERLPYYAEAVARKGAPLQNCWGFIDGTARHICRPSIDQEEYYSGHKRYHCLKFQSTVTPDGLIISLLGSFSGRRHDSVLWFFGSMYPGLNCSLEYDSAFGFLTHLNSEELKVLLNDESKLEEMAKDQKQYRDLEKEKEMLLASNQSLAEYNLSLQPKFELSKQELLDKTDVCDHLLQSLESKAALLVEKSGRSVLDSKLSSLQLVTSELEESSEDFADNFLAGEFDLEEFLDKFLSRRKQMHLEKVKADKMADMLKQYQMGF